MVSAAMLSIVESIGVDDINIARGSITRPEANNVPMPNFMPSDQPA
jgi:hypothetical protein